MSYAADPARYQNMEYVRCGASGLKLPKVSLGLWHNFGHVTPEAQSKALLTTAFDCGITHFDLANNYGPMPGAAEETFGRALKQELYGHRDELVISTKAGYIMWDGPYGDGGSRKYLMSSLDQSLKRMGLDYVDIFYHHRPDPATPMEETMQALADIVRSGKALYVGVSNYNAEQTETACEILRGMGVHLLVHQVRYNMLDRRLEQGEPKTLGNVLLDNGVGAVAFCPLAQGMLTDRYLAGIPKDSRAASASVFLKEEQINDNLVEKVRALKQIAENRGQSMAQLALGWVLENPAMTSVIIGASKPEQIRENCDTIRKHQPLTAEEKAAINAITA